MVELGFFPIQFTVAIIAFHAKLAAVNILNGMTIVTGTRQVFVDFADMTRNTLLFGMGAALGQPGNSTQQTMILTAALDTLGRTDQPGLIVDAHQTYRTPQT